ncbi:hypothetical protein SAMN05216303_105339 [Rhodoferax sp. OV413]|uniref:RNA polymerase sigma factor n=1 Tax=Rhodoferax sp. OV413 TaxID=1855285 RepID=UPI00088D35E7|nr:RNA polymerase sigma factor [Rhodoferax sp. OV413]SDP61609.1 hypothetical protein SAMN05216303_105339 [Rhodoferax sp. OV413]
MAKKIDRARIDSGRFELPKKLAFLTSEKVDFTSITDTDGDWSVQVPAAALQRIVKTKAELKLLKASNKLTVGEHAATLAAANAAHEESQRALASATRKIKALEKKLTATAALAPIPTAASAKNIKAVAVSASAGKAVDNAASATKPAKAIKDTQASKKEKAASAVEAKPPANAEVAVTPANVTMKTTSAKPAAKAAQKAPKRTKEDIKVVATTTRAEPIAVSADVIAVPAASAERAQPTEAVAVN